MLNRDNYLDCDSLSELDVSGTQPTGLDYGSGPGPVDVLNATPTRYDAVAHSRLGHRLRDRARRRTGFTRTCNRPSEGGCRSSGNW